jgi:hypothetical protein
MPENRVQGLNKSRACSVHDEIGEQVWIVQGVTCTVAATGMLVGFRPLSGFPERAKQALRLPALQNADKGAYGAFFVRSVPTCIARCLRGSL